MPITSPIAIKTLPPETSLRRLPDHTFFKSDVRLIGHHQYLSLAKMPSRL